jgi:hypothetical protein
LYHRSPLRGKTAFVHYRFTKTHKQQLPVKPRSRLSDTPAGPPRKEELPDEAPDKAGISEDVLFFQEAEKSLEGVCHDVFYINYGFV